MSLSSLFDIQTPTDFLRGTINTLNEYETSREEGDRPKMGVRGFSPTSNFDTMT
jgi:hypothetical protein